MTKSVHLDLEEDIRRLLQTRQDDTVWRAVCDGDPQALEQLTRSDAWHPVNIDGYADTPGPSQVQSLLRFVVSRDLERALEDAEADNIVYDQLGEHRILGAKKCKKAKKPKGS